MKRKKIKLQSYLVLALVFLFNPNINIIDLLPDFIAYFIIAKMLEKAADCAPYFEEARASALKLAWTTLAKIPAFMLVIFIRGGNTLDRDIFPTVSLIFGIVESILLIPFIKNLYSAFFYLGERTDAKSLIAPFSVSCDGNRKMRPEELRTYTIMFFICKSILFVLPEFFLLSGSTSDGTLKPAPLSRYYPLTLLSALIIGFIMGGIWLSRTKKYIRAIKEEGKYEDSLRLLARSESLEKYEKKLKLRSINNALIFLAAASFFTFNFAFSNTNSVNIFPGFIFAAFFSLAICRMSRHTKKKPKQTLIAAAIYAVIALAYLISSIIFHSKYDYISLVSDKGAQGAYIPVMILSVLEFAAICVLLLSANRLMQDFIRENTGISPELERYGKTEAAYHKELSAKCTVMNSLGILTALAKCVEICLKSTMGVIYSDVNNVPSAIAAPVAPWFGVIVTVFTVLYIGFTIYFTSNLRDECKMKYEMD